MTSPETSASIARESSASRPSGSSSVSRWSGKALFVVAVWGASFVATRIALETFTPAGLVAVRLLMGTAVLAAVARARRQTLWPGPSDRAVVILLGLILGGHLLLQALGLRYTSAINAGWIIAFTPVPIALGGALLLRQRLAPIAWAGLIVATSGIGLVILAETPGFAQARAGDALQLISCLTWTLYTLAGSGAVARSGALQVTLPAMIVGAIPLVIAGAAGGAISGPLTMASLTATIFLGAVCSGLGYYLWFDALNAHGAARTGSYIYLEPFVTVGVAAALLGEPVSGTVLLGGLMVLLGVWAVARGTGTVAAEPT